MELSFLRLPPSLDLADQVENFWFMRGPSPAAMPEGHRILPDGCMEFIFQLGDAFRERRLAGSWRLQEHLLFVAQMERSVDIQPTGLIDTVGIHFRPAGAAAFVSGDLSRFLNRIVPLERLVDEDLGSLVKRLRTARTPERKAVVLEAFLQARRGPGDPLISKAATQLSNDAGLVDLDSAARDLGLSVRQFRRRFESVVGIAPKRFTRLVRFQRVFERRQERDARAWSQVALDCGYYDQAHFNRDFRAFTGAKPRDILKNPDPLTECFLSVSSKTATRRRG